MNKHTKDFILFALDTDGTIRRAERRAIVFAVNNWKLVNDYRLERKKRERRRAAREADAKPKGGER